MTANALSIASPVDSSVSLHQAREVAARLQRRLAGAVRGRDEVIELVIIALLADGHVLLEDYPGSGKTTLARALGEAIVDGQPAPGSRHSIAAFRRIQFTPDLLPSDITGATIYEVQNSRFVFRPGPIFAHIVLADEINRTSPKVQAAMLEAMAEKQVTVDDETHALDALFCVIATQNPLDVAGTYPLPIPQLDRFLFKISMQHIERGAELEVLQTYPQRGLEIAAALPTTDRDAVLRTREVVRHEVVVAPAIKEALVDLARRIRDDRRVLQGASTRSLLLLLPALQARALIHGRDYVAPEDLDTLAPHVFAHRVQCTPGTDVQALLREHTAAQIESLAKFSLRHR